MSRKSFIKIDKRTICFDVPPQDIITKDNVTVTVNGVVYYRVIDANVTDFSRATNKLNFKILQGTLDGTDRFFRMYIIFTEIFTCAASCAFEKEYDVSLFLSPISFSKLNLRFTIK